eukprot:351839-Chlamydomonas_euryale.AAC.8
MAVRRGVHTCDQQPAVVFGAARAASGDRMYRRRAVRTCSNPDGGGSLWCSGGGCGSGATAPRHKVWLGERGANAAPLRPPSPPPALLPLPLLPLLLWPEGDSDRPPPPPLPRPPPPTPGAAAAAPGAVRSAAPNAPGGTRGRPRSTCECDATPHFAEQRTGTRASGRPARGKRFPLSRHAACRRPPRIAPSAGRPSSSPEETGVWRACGRCGRCRATWSGMGEGCGNLTQGTRL